MGRKPRKRSLEFTYSLSIACLVFVSSGLLYIGSFSGRLGTGKILDTLFFGSGISPGPLPDGTLLCVIFSGYEALALIPFFLVVAFRSAKGSVVNRLLRFAFLGVFAYISLFNAIVFTSADFPFFSVYTVASVVLFVFCITALAEGHRQIVRIPYPATSRVEDFFIGAYFLYKGIVIGGMMLPCLFSRYFYHTYSDLVPSVWPAGIFAYHYLIDKVLVTLIVVLNLSMATAYLMALRQIWKKTYSHLIAFLLLLGVVPDIPLVPVLFGDSLVFIVLYVIMPLYLLNRYCKGMVETVSIVSSLRRLRSSRRE